MPEVEMHSPSFRTIPSTRSVSAKRARSPDSPSERPIKRLSLATGGPLTSSENTRSFPSASSSRHSSEDWVKQAGGLSIDSPLFPLTDATIPELGCSTDEGMVIDTDESLISRRPLLPPLRTESPDDSTMHSQEQAPHPQFGSTHTSEITPPPGFLSLPAINILPATPELLSSTQPSIPSYEAMSISPTALYPTSGSPTKRQRFMMGPRANCEKCRLGVKGHWVHLN
ncbi:hypothetical protein GGX14DRAFT_434766 [Mycena pura]|uniref:Uncharacterized protein n=1 Tax=Mycena pura TaxID=153505 RepID=A0AAD6VPB6_9AGAR|nr:hypothetical protein GGX14DRAFT_434766 [Mycena pura]